MEKEQQGNINEILGSTMQEIAGALNTTALIAHAPEYQEVKMVAEVSIIHAETDTSGQQRLRFRHEVKVYLDGEYLSPDKAEEIYNSNETVKQVLAASQKAQQQMMEEAEMQRKMQAVRQSAPSKKIITLPR